ncbi:IAP-like protein 1 [Actinidia rufa]|uniref:IAP-like protein 1 n=1 Tax=Actinidia rufa TaxID=165716 RepID=A0A7J0G9U3_9ERIC|nr:IAP-like protein 1 [Actinidia rufa]
MATTSRLLTFINSSAGASSPAVPMNVGSIDWLGHGQGSKAGSLSRVASQPLWTSLSATAGSSAFGSSLPPCRPWERGDLLRRLSTFKLANWFGKPKVASSLSCARRGWINVDVDKIECESCSANLQFISSASWTNMEAESAAEDFAKQLDAGHKVTCPWRGNSCAESLVQFPPAPPSALIGGYKDRWDGLLQFLSLPVVAASAIEKMRVSRGPEIERFLVHSRAFTAGESGFRAENISGMENTREEAFCVYSPCVDGNRDGFQIFRTVKNILLNQLGMDILSVLPQVVVICKKMLVLARKHFLHQPEKGLGKNKVLGPEFKSESRSPLFDCSLCGATVKLWDFLTVSRPARFAPTSIDIPETSKKMALTRGVSAASGISGWVATDGMGKEQIDDHDEAATTDEGKSQSNLGVDLNLTMAGGLSSTQLHMTRMPEQHQDANMGRDLMLGQPSSSEVGDRAASYESRGPSKRKRNLDEAGSTVDRPHLMIQQADSVEGTVIDRDCDEVDDGRQYSAGPSKRSRDSDVFETYRSSYMRGSSGAGPSHSVDFGIETDAQRVDPFHQGNEQIIGIPSTRDSTHVSSVIAMDTVCHNADGDSMESVENYPGDVDDVHFPSMTMYRNPDLNDTSELNYSNQAQQSTCPAALRISGEMGVSSTNDGEEVLNTDTATAHGRDVPSFGISGGSVGMGASHEAEIRGNDVSVHRADSVVGDVEPIAEVTENQGQTGEYAPDPGLMGDFVPEEMGREDPHGDSQDLMFQPVGRADSGSKIVGSAKAESVESGEKTSNMNILPQENSTHPSFSCNAIVCSGYEASKEEVTQAGKASPTDDCAYPESSYLVANGIGPPNGESNYEEAVEFDPIKHHNYFCPWVNGNVAAAGCSSSSGSSSSAGAIALCGWQLTLDALDAFQSLGHVPAQTVESESAASLYKCLCLALLFSDFVGLGLCQHAVDSLVLLKMIIELQVEKFWRATPAKAVDKTEFETQS